jgi:hypothetical protein
VSTMGSGPSGGGGVNIAQVNVLMGADTSKAEAGAAALGAKVAQVASQASGPASAQFGAFGNNVAAGASKGLMGLQSMNMAMGPSSPIGPFVSSLSAAQFGLMSLGTETVKDASNFEKMSITGQKMAGVGLVIMGLGAAMSAFGKPLQEADAALGVAIQNTTNKITGQANALADYKTQIAAADITGRNYGISMDQVSSALAKLTVQTHDPTEALREMTFTETLAAATHRTLSDAADQVGRMHAGLFRSLRQFGIQLPNITNGAKDLAKAESQLSKDTAKLTVDQQNLADFTAKVADAMEKSKATWAAKVATADATATTADAAYQTAQQRQQQTQQTMDTARVQGLQDANQKVIDAQAALNDMQQIWADTDAARAQTLADTRAAAAVTTVNAIQSLQDKEEEYAMTPAKTGAEQFARMVTLRDMARTVAADKAKELEAAELVVVSTAEQVKRNQAQLKAQQAIVLSQQAQVKAEEAATKATQANVRAIQQVAVAFEKMNSDKAKLAAAQTGLAGAGTITDPEAIQQRKLLAKIAADQKGIDAANALKKSAQDQDAKLQAAFLDAEGKFMAKEKGLLEARQKTWAGHLAAITATVKNIAEQSGKWAPQVLAGGMGISAVGGVIDILGKLGGHFKTAGTAAEDMEKVAGKAGAMGKLEGEGVKLSTTFGPVVSGMGGHFGKIAEGAKGMVGKIGPIISGIGPMFESLGTILLGPVGIIILVIAGIAIAGYLIYRNWGTISKGLAATWNWIAKEAAGIWNGITSFFRDVGRGFEMVIGGIIGFFEKLPGRILTSLLYLPKMLLKVGVDMMHGLWNGILSMGGYIMQGIKTLVEKIIPGPIKSLLGIHSPSAVMHGLGQQIVMGLHEGMMSKANLIKTTTEQIAKSTMFNPKKVLTTGAGNTTPYNGVAAGATSQGQVVNLNFNMPVAGNVLAEKDLMARVKEFIQKGAQQSGGLSRFLSVQP